VKYKKISIFIFIFLVGTFIAKGEPEKKDFHNFDKDSQLENLSPPIRCFFDAAAQNDSKALAACFSNEVSVNIAGMRFNGTEEVVAFAERDIWGGKYKVEKAFKRGNKEIVHCLFWPQGWSSPEPPIEYQFQTKNGKIINWFGKYR
jgi:hypothetical protein